MKTDLSKWEPYMLRALELAEQAAQKGEVPVGAVVVAPDGKIIGEAFNIRESSKNPIAHAEILAIQEASQKIGAWRLSGCTVVVTLEPCIMCAGAMTLSRVNSCIYGAYESRGGALKSLYQIHQDKRLTHRYEARGGLLEEKSRKLLVDFFREAIVSAAPIMHP